MRCQSPGWCSGTHDKPWPPSLLLPFTFVSRLRENNSPGSFMNWVQGVIFGGLPLLFMVSSSPSWQVEGLCSFTGRKSKSTAKPLTSSPPFPFFSVLVTLYLSSTVCQDGPSRWLHGKESACQCNRVGRCGFSPWIRKIP